MVFRKFRSNRNERNEIINEETSLFRSINVRYQQNNKNTDNFIVCIKTEDIYKDKSKDFNKRYDTSNSELDRPLPRGKNKK